VADFLVIIGSVFFEVFFTEFGIVVVGVNSDVTFGV
jgi:hypothetical protein